MKTVKSKILPITCAVIALLAVPVTGCDMPKSQVDRVTRSGDIDHEITCIDGVEYLYLRHGYGGYMTPHFKKDGSLYLCENR